jgi:uncharacterized protein (TIGR02145 family)
MVVAKVNTFLLLLTAIAIVGASPQAKRGELEDPRDHQRYPTVEIAGMTWFARNLNYETGESYCYDGKPENCASHGRLYRWEAALTACPPGWHMSTEYEWQALELALGISKEQIEKEGNRGTEEGGTVKKGGRTGFDAEYGGWRRSEDGKYEALGRAAAYWTANESAFDRAWHRDVDTGDDQIWRSPVIKPYGLSVRCVKNRFEQDEK